MVENRKVNLSTNNSYCGCLTVLFLQCQPRQNDTGLPGGPVVKNLAANEGDTGLTPVQEDPTCHGATKPLHHNY